MQYYPIFANLEGKHCLVVGAGEVGRRKINSLLKANPEAIHVLDISCDENDLDHLLENPRIMFVKRGFSTADLNNKFLVIAATSNHELNQAIGIACKDRNILCNVADQPSLGSFIVPAVSESGNLTLAISTGGASPALARKIRQDMDNFFGENYGPFLTFMSRLRPFVLERGVGTDENTKLFRALVNSDLLEAMRERDGTQVNEILSGILPEDLKSVTEDLLYDLI